MKRGTSIHFRYTKHREITYQITSTMFLRIYGTEFSERRKQSKKGSPPSFWTLLWEAISPIEGKETGRETGDNSEITSVLTSWIQFLYRYFPSFLGWISTSSCTPVGFLLCLSIREGVIFHCLGRSSRSRERSSFYST